LYSKAQSLPYRLCQRPLSYRSFRIGRDQRLSGGVDRLTHQPCLSFWVLKRRLFRSLLYVWVGDVLNTRSFVWSLTRILRRRNASLGKSFVLLLWCLLPHAWTVSWRCQISCSNGWFQCLCCREWGHATGLNSSTSRLEDPHPPSSSS